MSRLRTWKMGDTYGGLNREYADHVLPDNALTKMDNWVLRSKGAETAKGWTPFSAQVLTDGAATPANSTVMKIDQYFKNDGTAFLVAGTNKRVYRWNETNDIWVPITRGTSVSTTIDATSSSGSKTLYVASTVGFSIGDTIIITDPGGSETEENVVDSITVGVSLNLLNNLSYTHTVPGEEDPVTRTYAAAIVDADSAAAQKVLNVSHTAQFTAGEQVVVGLGTSDEEVCTIASLTAGASLTMVDNLRFEHTALEAHKVYRMAELKHAQDATTYQAENSNNKFYFTDYANAIQVWDGQGAPTYSSALVGLRIGDQPEGFSLPASANVLAKHIASFEQFLILGNLNEDGVAVPQKIRWSQYGSENWEKWANEADGTGQAGYFTFDGPDYVMGLHRLKRELLVYRERSIEAMSYLGPPLIFGFRTAETGTGLISPNGLIDLGDEHLFVGPDDFYAYNGVALRPIGDSAVTREFFDTLDPSQKENVIAFYIEEEAEAWFCYSTTGDPVCDKAFVYSTQFNKWSGPRDVDATALGYYEVQSTETWDSTTMTWAELSSAWDSRTSLANAPISLMGNSAGQVFITDSGEDKNGTTYSRTLETKLLELGGSAGTARVQRVRLGFEQYPSTTVNVYLGYCNYEGQDLTWIGPQALTLSETSEGFVYFDRTARFFKVRVESTERAQLRTCEVYYIPRLIR